MIPNDYIRILDDDHQRPDWTPVLGSETDAALGRTDLDEPNRRRVVSTSEKILSKCVNPHAQTGRTTGLVVGYVQSGKTLSFTTVAAMANDNGYRLIIVIAGMTNDLSTQSHSRLMRDLGVEETPFGRWAEFFEPTLDDLGRLRDALAQASDPSATSGDTSTVLITLKKNHTRLATLVEILQELEDHARVPTLVIDDEADQASLNSLVRRNELSTTYRRIRELRDLLPLHTFLQYTATPQAPILINLIDVLSPDFPVVLDPGSNYTGGREFFLDQTQYTAEIPANEIPTDDNPLTGPPDSLLRALRLFFVGVASGRIRKDVKPPNRSMMVHPARETVSHKQYYTWVQSVRGHWMDTLGLVEGDPDRDELLADFFSAWKELTRTVDDLESFDAITQFLLPSIRATDARLVNSLADAKRDIHWRRNYSWILVGGQVLDRGFTVEGLTVTYMPRGPGVGNADTIQQRARFLGYKRPYLGFCRVFLEEGVSELYRRYVHHEEDVRARLVEHVNTGQPLSTFRRVFLLDPAFRPTRDSVIDVEYTRPSFGDGWCFPNRPLDTAISNNSEVIDRFLANYGHHFTPDAGHQDRTPHQKHLVAHGLSLATVYDELLVSLQTTDIEDSQRWTAVLMSVDAYMDAHGDAKCTVYRMRPDQQPVRQVRDGRIRQLFQGAYPVTTKHVYPGDRDIRAKPVTVQIHVLTLREGAGADGTIVASDLALAAIWMAGEVYTDIVVQPQGGEW